MKILKALWAYRCFIISSINTEFRGKFAQSKLSGIWMILNPLAQVAIYALLLAMFLFVRVNEEMADAL